MKELFDSENRTPLFLAANVVTSAMRWVGEIQSFLGMIAVILQIAVGALTVWHLLAQVRKTKVSQDRRDDERDSVRDPVRDSVRDKAKDASEASDSGTL